MAMTVNNAKSYLIELTRALHDTQKILENDKNSIEDKIQASNYKSDLLKEIDKIEKLIKGEGG
jgi:hypothetical protein